MAPAKKKSYKKEAKREIENSNWFYEKKIFYKLFAQSGA